ncbi:hypothetical protein ACHAWF_006237 [Thalassiosira exigua]
MLVRKSSALAALLAASAGVVADAFSSVRPASSQSTATASSSSTLSTLLRSTVPAPGSVVTDLAPPSSIDASSTSDLFESRVQKTYGRYPIAFVSGSGSTLTDESGKTYLDFVSGIATCALGHGNPELTKAVSDQMATLHHVSNLYYTPGQGLLAAWLCENSCADKAFFCNSGAESNEAAIKLARRHASNRGITDPVIITAVNSFHGRTLATVTATAQPKYHKGFGYGGEMVRGFRYTPYNDSDALQKLVEEVQTTPAEDAASGRKRGLAAIMLEPLQGEGGIRPGDPAYFALARKICDETGALLVCDEVQAGMGRTGTLWGHQQLGVEPDVFTSAKALGGGVPIGAMMARGAAADVFGPGDHASTYGGNPLACAAGLAVAEYLSEHDVLANVRQRGEQLAEGLADVTERFPQVLGEVRGWGLLRGVEIKEDAGCTAAELVGDAMAEGLLLVAAGPTVVRFVPPLVVTKEEVAEALQRFENAIAKRVGMGP